MYTDQALLAGIRSRVLFILVWCKNISAIDQIQNGSQKVIGNCTRSSRTLAAKTNKNMPNMKDIRKLSSVTDITVIGDIVSIPRITAG